MPASSPPPVPSTDEHSRPDGMTKPSDAVTFQSMAWPILLSLVVLALIGYFTFEPGTLREMARTMNPWLLAAAAGTTALQVVLGGWRFRHIGRGSLSLMDGTRAQLAWHFFSNVTPSAVGGGPPAALYIAHAQRIPVGEASAFMLFAMLLDQFWFILSIPLLFLASFYVDLFPEAVGSVGQWTFVLCFLGLLSWALVFAYATLVRPDFLERAADWIFRRRLLKRFHGRVTKEMRQLSRRAQTLRSQPPRFYAKGFLITAALWTVRYALVLFVVWSVAPFVGQGIVFLRTAALTFTSLVLPTPGGAGGLEGLYALFIGPLLPEKALMAPTLLAWRVLGYYVFIALGAYLFAHDMQEMWHHQEDTPDGPSGKRPPGELPSDVSPPDEPSKDGAPPDTDQTPPRLFHDSSVS